MARARLVLVRHGQASALSGDYDQLSELGREQSKRLGPWLARWARDPAHVLVGPRRRHRETYEEALAQATNPDDFALQVSGITSTSDARWENFDSEANDPKNRPWEGKGPAPAAAAPFGGATAKAPRLIRRF